jgi:hypothetical protein
VASVALRCSVVELRRSLQQQARYKSSHHRSSVVVMVASLLSILGQPGRVVARFWPADLLKSDPPVMERLLVSAVVRAMA